jgi:hypothetical protein
LKAHYCIQEQDPCCRSDETEVYSREALVK